MANPNPSPNPQNLVQNQDRTRNEAGKMSQKGGLASGEARRKNRHMRDLGQMIAKGKPNLDVIDQMKSTLPDVADEDLTTKMLLMMKQYEKALNGDTKAAEFIRDTIGEKPTDKYQPIISLIEATPEELKEAGLMTYEQWEESYNAVQESLNDG